MGRYIGIYGAQTGRYVPYMDGQEQCTYRYGPGTGRYDIRLVDIDHIQVDKEIRLVDKDTNLVDMELTLVYMDIRWGDNHK